MELIFSGHEYRYAAEQMLSTLFPGERPEYVAAPSRTKDSMRISLSRGRVYTTAFCRYTRYIIRETGEPDEEIFIGRSSVLTEKLTGETETDSRCQYIIKNAMYHAVLRSGTDRPPWGSLTGVRPGKLMSAYMREYSGAEETERRRASVHSFQEHYDVSAERAELCYETSLATLATEKILEKKDICLYVGIPFCPTRCAYCSFVSQSVEKSLSLMGRFFEALKEEIRAVAEQTRKSGLRVVAMYFGGGTPTTLSAEQLDELCSLLGTEFGLSSVREFTVEAGRPDTITPERLEVLRKHGVSRVSVNPQTMRDSVLEAIGRKHTAKDVTDALEKVRLTGGFDVNMDLIAGLPTDTAEGFSETLREVLALSPENITVHTLSLKRGSKLTVSGETIPAAAEVGQMLEEAYGALRKAGYIPYYLYRQKNMSGGFENTGWTKPGHINIYNICMMEELCSIYAFGAGGSSKIIENGKITRKVNPKYPLEYIKKYV